MKQSIFAAIVVAMAVAVFLTFNYNVTGHAQAATVHATPAVMMQGAMPGACAHTSAMGTGECPYAKTASMQSGQCPYEAACSNGASCPHAGTSGTSMNAGSNVQMVPVMQKTAAKSDADCPAGCPSSMCSGHHATASR